MSYMDESTRPSSNFLLHKPAAPEDDTGDKGFSELKRAVVGMPPKRVDDFPLGTVIRWTVEAVRATYIYAAVKTPVGWSTTATAGNRFISQTMSFVDLVDYFADADDNGYISNVEVAYGWLPALDGELGMGVTLQQRLGITG